jgi:flavin reductase (DIM6/NTAB) family NADH-FMN oxidoreductase RutF
VLETAVAAFDCRRSHQLEVGGHTIFFGEVCAVRLYGSPQTPLLYAHGDYGRFGQAPRLSAAQAILSRLSPL